jgi:hypothetical protein
LEQHEYEPYYLAIEGNDHPKTKAQSPISPSISKPLLFRAGDDLFLQGLT